MMKLLKYFVTILILLILITISFVFFLDISEIGYINYENYFKTNGSQTKIRDELDVFAYVTGMHTEQNGIFAISKAPYMATITISLSSEITETVKIKAIDFVTKKGDVISSLDECCSVYDSSKEAMINENIYIIQNDMYMNFNYERLKLPDEFYIQISYLYEDNIKNKTLLLKKSRRMYLTII